MTGYDVIIGKIRDRGTDAATAGEDTKAVDLPGTVSGLGQALPDTASALAANTLVTAWETRIRMLGDDLLQLSSDLTSTADEYTRNEAAAEDNIDIVAPRYQGEA